MKHLRTTAALSLLFTTLFIVSCSKKEEPEPSMGDQVAGNYVVTKIGFSGLFLEVPYTDPSSGGSNDW